MSHARGGGHLHGTVLCHVNASPSLREVPTMTSFRRLRALLSAAPPLLCRSHQTLSPCTLLVHPPLNPQHGPIFPKFDTHLSAAPLSAAPLSKAPLVFRMPSKFFTRATLERNCLFTWSVKSQSTRGCSWRFASMGSCVQSLVVLIASMILPFLACFETTIPDSLKLPCIAKCKSDVAAFIFLHKTCRMKGSCLRSKTA